MSVVAGVAAFSIALAIMLSVQPEQGQVGQFGILVIYRGRDKSCLHVHHWITFLLLALFLLLGAWCSGNTRPTPQLFVILGLLLGIAASDVAYSDSLIIMQRCPG